MLRNRTNKYNLKLKSSTSLNFELPKSTQVIQLKSKLPTISSEKNFKKAIYKAIENSEIYSLKEVVDKKKPIVIIIDDHTRKTPVFEAIEILYEKLQQMGVKNNQIFILVSSGTHRKMKQEELYKRIGYFSDILTIVQHDCYDIENLFLAGNIDGIPIILNKLLQQEATIIGIGSIVAHKFSGWSGGGKIVCPGVTGYETILLSHRKAIIEYQIVPGMRNNWFRTFIDRVSDLAGLKYTINFVPGINGFFDVFAGEPDAVLAKGIEIANENFFNWVGSRCDIAIISAFPATIDIWQSGKGFYLGDMVVKDKGTIILVTPLDEGKGDHPDFLSMLNIEPFRIKNILEQNLITDPLAAVAAYAVRNIAERCVLRIVSTNSTIQHEKILNHEVTDNFQNVIDESLSRNDSDVVIFHDIYVLPEQTVKNI